MSIDEVRAQSYTSTSATGAWNTSRWNNSADGPAYTSAYTANNPVIFSSGDYFFAGMGAALNVGNITVNAGANVNFATIGSTFATGGNVRTIDVAAGSTFDFNGQALSTAAGTGFIKSGGGVLGTGAGIFTGGFTLSEGTVVARGTTGLGSGGSNTLALNGGTITANASRDFADTRFPGGITVGGNVQFGAFASAVSISSDSARLTFANAVSLGGARRTLTIGNFGNHAFSGVISSGSLTFAAVSGAEASASGAGRFDITNTANTFTGDIEINGPEVRFTADGSLGNASNGIVIDGGRFAKASDATTVTLGAGRTISVGDGAGTSISSPGTGILVYNGAIADKSGETGGWAKQGGGTFQLGGVSTYTGATAINNGTLQLTTGNDRLPTGTTVSLGQAASTNVGTFDLNARSQQIAGLNSTTGTNATASNNTVTSASAATLTLGGSGNYSYGDGTDANSGVITGAITLIKSGSGNQILGDINTYTGGTTVSGGTLTLGNTTNTLADTGAVEVSGGTLALGANSDTVGAVTLSSGIITSSTGVLSGSSYQLTNTGSISAILGGSGALTKTGSGTATLSGTNTYTGTTTVSAGTLVIDGNQSAATGNVTVAAGATLTGSGTIGGATTIAGTHSPGNSPGVQTFASGLTYSTGSTFVWELIGNTVDGFGTNFDRVNVTGNLAIGDDVTSSLVFNGAGSTVNWSDPFWDSNRSWLVFTGASSITGTFGSIIASVDLTNASFESSIGAFGWRADGGNLFLDFTANITAVPEPASWGGSLVLLGLWAARRRSARRIG